VGLTLGVRYVQAQEAKVLEIATEKCQLAVQTQRHMANHIARLSGLHGKFEKELGKSDPDGLAEVLNLEAEYVPPKAIRPVVAR
jgi:hypothetical protein